MPVKENTITTESGVARHHFHTFDALRFFAFFKVFLLHIPIVARPWFNTLRAGGGIGVMFFFVLSGFLITYIVGLEKNATGTIQLKNFFVRRVLRIWPLYYLMVLVAYTTPFLIDHVLHISSSGEGYEPKLWVSALFLENYMMMATHTHANVSPLSVMWSLCIEEHFYIVWGITMYFMNVKTILKCMYAFLIVGIVCRYVYVLNDIPTSDLFTNIDLFAFGAIPAILLVQYPEQLKQKVLSIPYWLKAVFILSLVTIVVLCGQLKTDAQYIWPTTLLGALFAGLLLIIIPERNRIKINDTNILSRLGVYTYGLYMYHTLVINLLKQVFNMKHWSLDEPVVAMVFFAISLLATVVCSVASYYLFEKQFLKLKRYFR
ncbi:MAG: acyltransferase [Sphingobacteriales bacterium]|nr:MAG: acyltransferase [Sphingobacteriales bacterium]